MDDACLHSMVYLSQEYFTSPGHSRGVNGRKHQGPRELASEAQWRHRIRRGISQHGKCGPGVDGHALWRGEYTTTVSDLESLRKIVDYAGGLGAFNLQSKYQVELTRYEVRVSRSVKHRFVSQSRRPPCSDRGTRPDFFTSLDSLTHLGLAIDEETVHDWLGISKSSLGGLGTSPPSRFPTSLDPALTRTCRAVKLFADRIEETTTAGPTIPVVSLYQMTGTTLYRL